MRKHWKKILLIVVLLGLALLASAAYGGYRHDQGVRTESGVRIEQGKDGTGRAFTKAELAAAEAAIAKGIKIDDPQGDFYQFPEGSVQGDGRPDNTHPYPLGWTDYRSVSVGADEKYLYFKFQFWDVFPKRYVTYQGDLIQGTGAKITQFEFLDKDGKKDSADLGASVMYAYKEEGGGSRPLEAASIGADAMISPYGLDATMETLFKKQTSEGMVSGGPGTDYLLAAYPLALFNLKLGDTVTFDASTESGSDKFHHEAVDLLLGKPGEKWGDKIRWQVGSSAYEVIKNPDYSGHS